MVTGGASGLGEAISRRLSAEGAAVFIVDRDGAEANRVATDIRADGGSAQAVTADVRHDADVQAAVHAARERGRLDVVVLSAAIEEHGGVVECTDDQWANVLETNLKGPFLVMRAVIPFMAESGGGAVIALGSTLGLSTAPGYAAYATSKGALVNLCKQAAIENADRGVRVNVVAPSATSAGLFMRVSESAPDPEARRREVASGIPMHRLGDPEDVTQAVLFLASAAARFISGVVLPVDGASAAMRVL